MLTHKSIDRRSLIAAGTAALGAGMICATAKADMAWDKETDVVVIGCGYAGACAAISALDEGASVIVLEKAPVVGGSSYVAVGTIHTAIRYDDVDAFIQTRLEQTMGMVADEEVDAYVRHEEEIGDWLEFDLGMDTVWTPRPDQGAYMANRVDANGNIGNGADLFGFFEGLMMEKGAEVLVNSPAIDLIQDTETKEVLGVVADTPEGVIRIKAVKGVVLSCGGYENNPQLQYEYHFPGIPFVPWGTPYNTGDGIALAQKVGARMWHFSCFEYAGLAPKAAYEQVEGNPVFTMLYNNKSFYGSNTGGSFMIVNKDGKRFFNENMGIGHQKTTIPFNQYDSSRQQYVNYPFFFLCDEALLAAGPIAGLPVYNAKEFTYAAYNCDYRWSADNAAEIEAGWIVKADSVEEMAEKLGVDAEGLAQTVAEFNANESDPFGRAAEDKTPLQGTLYAVECLISVINTMGGAQRDAESRVIGYDGQPIPRLYGGGEFGSFNGAIEYSFGNIAEAITSGRFAGLNAAQLESRA